MDLKLFILISFIIGFISDIILYILATNKFTSAKGTLSQNTKNIINSLSPYFNHYKILSPFLAGITVVVGTLVSYGILLTIYPKLDDIDKPMPQGVKQDLNISTLSVYIIILFLFGILLDYLINITGIFRPYLNKYYKKAGLLSILFGGIANLIVGIPAYFISRQSF